MNQQGLQAVSVGLGELQTSRDPAIVLVAHGLGSCVGVCAYDPQAKVAALLHAMLPNHNGSDTQRPTKYVDSGIERLLKEMAAQGALRSRILFRVAGGAQMLIAPGLENTLNIGARNSETALEVMKREGLRLVGTDVGGHWGRTVRLHVATGQVFVRAAGKGEQEIPWR